MVKGRIEKNGNNVYQYVQKLGAGSYGTTWMGISNGKKVAIKIFSRTGKIDTEKIDDISQDWEAEIASLKQILPKCCPHAVCIKDYYFKDNRGVIVMDFVRGETLNKQIIGSKSKRISFEKRKKDHTLLKNLVEGIKVIHSMNIVHQDIKGDNIMFDFDFPDGMYRYIDWGMGCIKKGEKIKKDGNTWPCGSIGTRYTVPKDIIIQRKKKVPFQWKQLEAHDYWSIGIVLLRWYTYNGDVEYYDNIVSNYAKTKKEREKLQNLLHSTSFFPYYYEFPKDLLLSEICKISNLAVRTIVELLLQENWRDRWNGFQTVLYMLDKNAPLADGSGKWKGVRKDIEKLRE
jgi:serine/threonine protein kinase